jgi:SAM-dependent methyltransferase
MRGPDTFLYNDAVALAFKDGVFDHVLFFDVMEHIQDDRRCIREIHRVLRPGGKLYLCTPSLDGGFLYIHIPAPKSQHDVGVEWGHVRDGYTTTELMGLLNGLFTLEHSEKFNSTFASIGYQLFYNRGWIEWWDKHRAVRWVLRSLIHLDRLFANNKGTAIFMILTKRGAPAT